MANSLTTQLLVDGPKNAVIKIVGVLDTIDLASTVIVDPSVLEAMSIWQPAAKVKINRIIYDIELPLELRLFWDATTPVYITDLTGQGHQELKSFGGLINNAGAGVTGKITATTQGWSASAILSFNLILELIKTT